MSHHASCFSQDFSGEMMVGDVDDDDAEGG
jgi:hypothetical protein